MDFVDFIFQHSGMEEEVGAFRTLFDKTVLQETEPYIIGNHHWKKQEKFFVFFSIFLWKAIAIFVIVWYNL